MRPITLQELLIALAIGAVVFIVARKLFASDGPSLMAKVKDSIFTMSGLITTIIHVFIFSGIVTCYVLFQSQVMGNDPIAAAKATAAQGKGK